jgi:translation initiation factor 4A
MIESWDDFEMDTGVLRGIYSIGFEKPSPIQSKAIKPMMDGKDLLAQAQSGTGKTGAFSIGTLNRIDTSKNTIQAVILSPTRELSQQSYDVITSLSSFMDNLKLQLLVGGTSVMTDIEQLTEQTPHIVVGCPGRTFDMIKRGHLVTKELKIIVIDEADELLSSGFKEQIYNIFQYLSSSTQVCLFSASMPPEVEHLTEKFMVEPEKILVKSELLTLEGIEQYHVALDNDGDKFDCLKDLYASLSVSQSIIYCNSIKRVDDLYDAMMNDSFAVSKLHGNMEKEERTTAYENFKNGKSRILISSNVTARGIDIQQVSTVINFDLPKSVHTYLHRIGRSGRWGRKGVGINFVTRFDLAQLKAIEQFYHTKIEELPASFVQT